MKNIVTLLFAAVALLASAQSKQKIAIYVSGDDQLNEICGAKMTDALAQSGKYQVIERTAGFLAEMSKEQDYQRTGAVDDDQISNMGKQMGVNYVCVVSIADVFKEKYISARIIDVENAEIAASGCSNSSLTSSQQFISCINDLSTTLLKGLDAHKRTNATKVAVYVTKTGNNDIDLILGDQLVAGFSKSGRYVAVERTNSFLSQLGKEQDYQHSGAVNDDDIVRMGKQSGVQFICIAKAAPAFGEYYVSARLINLETTDIVNTANIEGCKFNSVTEVMAVASNLASKLAGKTLEEKENAQREAKDGDDSAAPQDNASWVDMFKKAFEGTSNNTYCHTKDGKKVGVGAVYRDNYIYLGGFDNDKRTGKGVYIWLADGKFQGAYVGQFVQGLSHGEGTRYDKDGKLTYYGAWDHDKQVGGEKSFTASDQYYFKMIRYKSGSVYVGEIDNGVRNGQGMYIWPNGDFWYGTWQVNQRHGYGIQVKAAEKSLSKGHWEFDKKVNK